ncbi:cell division protein SepF [Microbacterium aurum]
MVTEAEAVRAALDLEADLLEDLGDTQAADAARSRAYARTLEHSIAPEVQFQLDHILQAQEALANDLAAVRRELGSRLAEPDASDQERPRSTGRFKPARDLLTVHPRQYRDAQVIAEAFREGVPVVVNLSRMESSDARRIVDFIGGLAQALSGRVERVTSTTFLLSPGKSESLPVDTSAFAHERDDAVAIADVEEFGARGRQRGYESQA